MNEELQGIIDRMRAANEPEDVINAFIEEYNLAFGEQQNVVEEPVPNEEPVSGEPVSPKSASFTFEEGELEGFEQRMRESGESDAFINKFKMDYSLINPNAGKSTTTDMDATVDANEVSGTEFPLVDGSLAELEVPNNLKPIPDSENTESGELGFWDKIDMLADGPSYNAAGGIAATNIMAKTVRQFGNMFDAAKIEVKRSSGTDEINDFMDLTGKSFNITDPGNIATIDAWQAEIEMQANLGQAEGSEKFFKHQEKLQESGETEGKAFFKSMMKYPGLVPEVIVGSLAGMGATMAAEPLKVIGSTVAGGLSNAAIAGAYGAATTGGVAAFPAAIAGFVRGAGMGFRASTMYQMEKTMTFNEIFLEAMEERNLDPQVDEDIFNILSDPEAIQQMKNKAAAGGLALAAIETMFGRIGGLVGKNVNKAVRKSRVLGAVGETALEGTGGALGEYGKGKATGRDATFTDKALEVVSVAPMGGANVAKNVFGSLAEYKINGKTLESKKDIVDLIENGTDAEILAANIEVQNDSDLTKLLDKRLKTAKKANKKTYLLNGQKFDSPEEINNFLDTATDEQIMGVDMSIINDNELSEKYSSILNRIIKSKKSQKPTKKKPKSKVKPSSVQTKVEPRIITEEKTKIDTQIVKLELELQKAIDEGGETAGVAIKKNIENLVEKKKNIEDYISLQVDELSETEARGLVDLDNEVALYQSIIDDPSSTPGAMAAAKNQIAKAKEAQVEAFMNPDSKDLSSVEPKKQKNIELSKKTQEAYEKGDTDGIIEAQGGMISSIATSLWSRIPADKQVGTYDGFKAALISAKGGLLDLIGTYRPETGVPLAAWIGNGKTGLKVRANRIVKELTKQDIEVSTDSTEALNSFSSNEIDIDNINLGSKYNSQRLGLGVNLLNDSAKSVELGQVAIEQALADADTKADAKGKPLSQKQRQTVSEKAFNKFFKDQYVQTVKDRMGKKLDLKDYIKNNVSTLKQIALSNIDFQMGTGITKDWNKYPPSDQVFQDYYEGTDTDNAQAISDRKKKLAEAVSDQIAKDAKDNYFEGKEADRNKFSIENDISFSTDKKIVEDISEFIQGIKNIARAAVEDAESLTPYEDVANFNKFIEKFKGFIKHDNTNKLDRNNPGDVKKIQEELLKAAEDGKIHPLLLIVSKFGNFGRAEVKGYVENGVFIKRPSKVSIDDTKNYETYYELSGPVEGSVGNYLKRPESTQEAKIIAEKFKDSFLPGRGGIFYGVKDPKYVNLLKIATENYNGIDIPGFKITDKEGSKRLSFGTKSNNIFKKNGIEIDPKAFEEVTEKFKETAKNNQLLVKELTKAVSALIKGGGNPYTFGSLLHNSYRATSGAIKASFEFKVYEGGVLEYGTGTKFGKFNAKGGVQNIFREEHSPPVKVFGSELLKAALTIDSPSGIDARVNDMYKDAFQSIISLKSDQIINDTGYGAAIAKGGRVGENSGIIRLAEAGVSLKKLFYSNGKNVHNFFAEQMDISMQVENDNVASNEKIIDHLSNKVERDLQGALQVEESNNSNPELNVSEKIEAFIDVIKSAYKGSFEIVNTKEDAVAYLVSKGMDPKKAQETVDRAKGFYISRTDGLMYVNPELGGLDTLLHETTHAWTRMISEVDPELFDAIYEKLKGHPLYAEAVARMGNDDYKNIEPGSFKYKDEILAYILGEEGGSMYDLFPGDIKAKNLIDKFFQYVAEALGFDPSTKDFASLSIEQVVKLAIKDISEGNPASNFNKLKNKAEGKSWFAKTEDQISPSSKAAKSSTVRAFNALKLAYRESGDLVDAIIKSYDSVKNEMTLQEWAKIVAKNTKEPVPGKSNDLLIGKSKIKKAEKISEASVDKNKESELSESEGKKMADKLRAIIYGKTGKPSKWFIPPNAEDFKGLLYTFLPEGKAGVAAKKWLTDTLLKPYSNAIAALDSEILNKSNAWKTLSKGFDFNIKIAGTPYTLGDAIKIYNGLKNGQDPNIAKKKHLDALIHAVESDSKILNFANEVNKSFPIDITSGWQNRSFAKEIFDSINDGSRKRHLASFNANVDAIFTDATLDLIADKYGIKYKQALVGTLARMKSGRNRVGTDASANSYMNWINRAVGTTMFLNTRSAFLQTLSSLNFINKPGNNLFQAMRAFANQAQWKADYKVLWNSDYLVNRRDGAKFDVLADEMSQGDVKGIEKLLKSGFLPTRYADSFAIAMGGAAFYRNRVNMLTKDGMSKADAEAQAMVDWREAAEESQQSSDPSKISEIQSSSIGKLIYAFANTPFQYARLTKRKLQDLTSGRSAAEGNVQKDIQSLLYYSILQSVMFNALQNGLVALTMSDDPKDDELKDEKYAQILERTLTSYAKSIGNPGAVAATLYAMLKEGYMQQTGERRKDANVFALTATSISPPLNSKLKDLSAAYRAYNKIDEKDLLTPSLDSDALTMAGEVSSFVGVPLDRVVKKTRHLAAITNEEVELWQKVWMLAGWSEWELGVGRDSKKKNKPKKSKKRKGLKSNRLTSPNRRLEDGVDGVANKDGTIELAPDLDPVEKEITIAHEQQHIQDMDAGILDYDNDFVYWKNKKYRRKNGKIIYNGRSVIEGSKSLPWEKKAYDAEPSKSAVKRKLYE